MRASDCFRGFCGESEGPPCWAGAHIPVTQSQWGPRVLQRATAFTKGSGPWAERSLGRASGQGKFTDSLVAS